LSSFPFLQNQTKNKIYCVVQKIKNVKLKIKNFRNDQIKNEFKKKNLTLLVVFCLLLVAPKK